MDRDGQDEEKAILSVFILTISVHHCLNPTHINRTLPYALSAVNELKRHYSSKEKLKVS
jgi:hypothetical protein